MLGRKSFQRWHEGIKCLGGIRHALIAVCMLSLLSTYAVAAYPTLPDSSVPSPEPAAQSGWDTFSPPVDGQTPPSGAPAIAEWTRTAGPDDTVTATGTAFSTQSGSDAGKDTTFILYGQTTSSDGTEGSGSIQRLTSLTTRVTAPSTLPSHSMYLLWPRNSVGVGYPAAVNRAESWWLGPTALVTRGDTVAVHGRNLSHDGGTTSSWVYIKPTGSSGVWATVTEVDPYRVAFTVPQSLSNGTYEVRIHNGHGGSYGWSGPLSLTITDGHTWSNNVYNVKNYGAVGNGVTDDYNAINAAANASASDPWSTVYFPAGTYAVRSSIILYAHQRWLGDGMNSTYIVPRSNYDNVYGLIISGSSHSLMQDLTVAATAANFTYATVVQWRSSDDIQFNRVRFNGANSAVSCVLDVASSTSVTLKDCDIIGIGSYLGNAKNVFLDGCDFYGCYDANTLVTGWGYENVSMIRCTAQDLDNSNPNSGAGWAQGRFFCGGGIWGSCRNTYLGHNTSYDMGVRWAFSNINTGEQFMWEGNNAYYSGTPTASTTTTVTFSNLTTDYSDGSFDAIIVGGPGLGQHRKVTAFNSGTRTITVSPAWRLQPGTTSKVVIGRVNERCAIYGNALDGKADHVTSATDTASTAIEPYGGCLDFAADNNSVTDSRYGISSWTLAQGDMSPQSVQPTYFNYYANNSITNSRNGIMTVFAYATDPGNSLGTAYLGNTFRGNTINGALGCGAMMYRYWSSLDVPYDSNVFEHNSFSNTPFGIQSDYNPCGNNVQNTLFYKNTFSRGTATYAGSKGVQLGTGQLPALRQNTWTGFETTYAGTLPGAVLEIPCRSMELTSLGTTQNATMTIWNSGTSSLSWSATDDASWLTLTSSSGSIANENSSADITLTCDPTGLPAGTYTGTVTITGASQTMKVTVLFTVAVASPTFSPAAGTYTGTQSVTISTTTSGASIRYTTDGTTPSDTAGTAYSGAVSVPLSLTLKAIAYKSGMVNSSVTSAAYTIVASEGSTWDYASDFASTSNPNGVWSYGRYNWTSRILMDYPMDWTLQLETAQYTGNFMKWATNGAGNPDGDSGICYKNVSGGTITTTNKVGNCNIPAGSAGIFGNRGSSQHMAKNVRFTAPAAGEYTVHAVFTDQTTGTNESGVGVYQNWTDYNTAATWTDTINNTSKVSTTYDHTFTLTAGSTLDFCAGGTNNTWTLTGLSITIASGQAEAPTFNPAAGTYTGTQSVTISTTTSGASIRYTTDGTTPSDTAGTAYSSAVSVPWSLTLKAIAYKSGMANSSVTSGAYSISWSLASDFGSTSNPNGVWTYGAHSWNTMLAYGSPRDWTLQLETTDYTGNYMKWSPNGSGTGGIVYKNISGSTITTTNTASQWTLNLGAVNVPNGSVGVVSNNGSSAYGKGVRFTAPSAGDYTVHAVFTDQTTGTNSSTVAVYQNWTSYAGTATWSNTIDNVNRVSSTYDHTFSLPAGGTLDFIAGGAGSQWTLTGLNITITSQ